MRISFGNRVIGTGLCAMLAAAGLANAGDYSSWARYRTVTVNTTDMGLSGNVAKYPLLARFNATDHADMLNNGATQILPGGADIRVTKADGTTDVPFEIEQATTGADGSLVLWILADNVAQNSANAAGFRVYWGKAGQTSASSPSAVFDTANGFVSVWHMNGGNNVNDTLRDVTVNGNYGVLSQQAGQDGTIADTALIGNAKVFGGSNTGGNTAGFYYAVNNTNGKLNLNTDNGPYTLSAWVVPKVCASNSRIAVFSKYSNANGNDSARGFGLQTSPSGAWRLSNAPKSLATGSTTNINADYSADGPCVAGELTYISGSYSRVDAPAINDPTGASLWLNDTLSPTALATGGAQGSSIGDKANVFIGRLHNLDRFYRGSMDEVRVSKVALSSDWKRLDYRTQRPAVGNAVTIGATQVPGVMDYTAWSGHADVVLNTSATGANVAGTVTDFPVLIRLGASEGAVLSAANDGNSIRFSKADNATPLPYQIEHWSPTAAAIWVKVDTILGNNATQKIRMHWGNASAAGESNGAAVFDTTAKFRAVWHLGETASPSADATPLATPATWMNAPASVPGLIGNALNFANPSGIGSANAKYLTASYNATNHNFRTNGTRGLTISAWVRRTNSNGDAEQGIAGRYNWTNNRRQVNLSASSTQWKLFRSITGTNNEANFGTATVVDGEWTHVVGTVRNGQQVIYVNGVANVTQTTATISSLDSIWPAAPFLIGRMETNACCSQALNGAIDEVRFADTTRSADWIKLEYENQKAANSLVSLAGLPVAPTKPYTTWTNSRSIVLNTSASGANVSGTVTNFPVLVRLGSNESSIISAANNGNSIRFTKADSMTVLPYQIESWSSTAAAIWVKVDTVKGNNNSQSILMYWGNPSAADSSRGAAVFDTANGHRAVFHMQQATGDVVDATVNAVVGTNVGTTTTANGLAGPARTFAGTNAANTNSTEGRQFINLNNPAALNFAGRITMSAWIRWTHVLGTENESYYRTIINRDGTNPSAEVFLRIGHTSGNVLEQSQYATGKYTGSSDIMAQSPLPAPEYPDSATWTHLAGVYDSVATNQRIWRLYRNGVQIATSTHSNNAGVSGASSLWRLGRGPGSQNARWFVGDMDEVRIDAATRDSNYIKLSYENQKPVNSLVNIGNPTLAIPGAPASVTATPSTTTSGAIVVSWTAPASNGNAPITAYNVTVASGTPNTATCATTGALTCTITGLTPGSAYTFSVRATNSVGQGPAATSASVTAPTGILPGSFVIRMDGKTRPYAYHLPADVAAVTEELTMTIIDVHGKKVWSKTVNPAANNIRELAWDGTNTAGMKVSAGMYVVRINAVANGQSFESHGKGVLTP